jgi:hypothetical protein
MTKKSDPNKKESGKKKTAAKKQPAKKAAKKKGPKGKKDLMCFLTTACVRYYGLPDNCNELETLRKYRDSYLLGSERGKALVADYYQVAPEIVRQIEDDLKRDLSYKYIYNEIREACKRIGSGQNVSAQAVYENLVNTLCLKYKIRRS